MNCFIKEILVIQNDGIIDHLLIGGNRNINVKIGDKTVSPVGVGKVVKKSRIIIPSFNQVALNFCCNDPGKSANHICDITKK
jgi:hypothetical protein